MSLQDESFPQEEEIFSELTLSPYHVAQRIQQRLSLNKQKEEMEAEKLKNADNDNNKEQQNSEVVKQKEEEENKENQIVAAVTTTMQAEDEMENVEHGTLIRKTYSSPASVQTLQEQTLTNIVALKDKTHSSDTECNDYEKGKYIGEFFFVYIINVRLNL